MDIVSLLSFALDLLLVAAVVLTPYAGGGAILPFVLALSRLRIRSRPRAVRISGLDPGASFWSGFVLWPLALPAFFLGAAAGWSAVFAGLVLWLSFRVRVRVTPRGTRVLRCVAFVLPWWGWRTPGRPSAFVDGWGDFMDPEALHLAAADGRWDLELAWSHARSGDRAEALARAINAAVAALPE